MNFKVLFFWISLLLLGYFLLPEVNAQNIGISRLLNFHVDSSSFNNPTSLAYFSGRAQTSGTAYQAEFYVETPPTATTTIGTKQSFLGPPTCSVTPLLSEWPTQDFMTITFNNYATDPDCWFDAGDPLYFTIIGNPATSALRLNGFKDPFFPTQSTYIYLKITSIEPWVVQDNGEVVFMLGWIVFFWAILFFGMIFNKIRA